MLALVLYFASPCFSLFSQY